MNGGPDYECPLWAFVGRSDVFAYQQEDGSYRPERRPLTSEDLWEHEAGFSSVGTYTIIPTGDEFMVRQVIFDLDVMDDDFKDDLCSSVEHAIDPLGDPGAYKCLMLERSGGKGYHVWLFLDGLVPAYKVRAWLDERFWPHYRTQEHPYDKLEVFPKQDRLSEGGLGNLVKVPFGVHARTGNRSELVAHNGWVSQVSNIQGMDTAEILAVPDRTLSERIAVTRDTPTGVLLTDGPVARFLKGEVEQGERNMAFHAFFTWTAWNVHLPQDLAYQWWERLNDELPDPEDDLAQVEKTMESAYSRPPADAATPRRGRPQRAVAPAPDRLPLTERLKRRREGAV